MGDDLPELSRPKPGLTRRRRETPSRCDGRPVPLRGRATPGRSGRHRRFACAVAAGPRDRGLDVPQGTGRRRNDGWAPSRGRRTGAAGDREGRDRIARKDGGSARIDGREARTRLRLGTVATARRPGCLERRGGGARAAPSSPAGGTRGIGRTRGRFRVRSRSTGGGFEFKAARRPSTPAGAPAKAGATVTTGGAYRSDQPRLRRQGAFCPARTTACDRKIAPDASFYSGELVRERWSRQLACASRRNLHRNVGALVVPPGQNGANVKRRFAFLTSIWVARGGPPANGFWPILLRY